MTDIITSAPSRSIMDSKSVAVAYPAAFHHHLTTQITQARGSQQLHQKEERWRRMVSGTTSALSSTYQLKGGDGYRVERVTEADSERVLDLLRKFFFHDEPLNICVGLLREPGERCLELEEYCKGTIPDGLSCMAVSEETGELLGVCLSGILTREDCEGPTSSSEQRAQDCGHPRFYKIANLLSTVAKASNVFGQFPDVDSVVDLRVLSVDDACRGRGIAKALIENTKILAKEQGIKMVRVDCTSHFSALAVARLGFHCVYQLNYSDHLDEEGKPVFEPEPPHSCVKTFVAPV